MSNTYTSFAVAGGTGGLGAFLVSELVSQGATRVVILSRNEVEAVPAGATVRKVDYGDEASLVSALQDVEVLICVLGSAVLATVQPGLATAAKRAGVKLFVPSEFGGKTKELPPGSLIDFKKQMHTQLESIGLPYTLFWVGFFTDIIFIPQLGFDVANKKLAWVGLGQTPVAFTTRPDIAHFAAYILTHQPISKLENAVFRIEGDSKTFVELLKVFEEVYGETFTSETRSVEATEKKIAEAEGRQAFIDFLLLNVEKGGSDFHGENDNALVPGFAPLDVTASLRKWFQ